MSGKLVVFGVIILIVLVVLTVLQGSEFAGKVKKSVKKVWDKLGKLRRKTDIEITNAPTLQIKMPGSHKYQTVEVTKKKFKIGGGSEKDNHLLLNDAKVEIHHAAIEKKLKGDRVCYEFINYAKTNPSEYYNKRKKRYEYLGYNDRVELDPREAFYVGDTKIIVTLPVLNHLPTETEMVESDTGSYEEAASKETVNRSPSERVTSKSEIAL